MKKLFQVLLIFLFVPQAGGDILYYNNFNSAPDWTSGEATAGYQTTHSEAIQFGFSSYRVGLDIGGDPLYTISSAGCDDGKCIKHAVEFNGSFTGGGLDLQFGDPDVPWESGASSVGYRELWVRYRVKFPSGWTWGGGTMYYKNIRFYTGKDYATEWAANNALSTATCEYMILDWGGGLANYYPSWRPHTTCVTESAQDYSAPWNGSGLEDGGWHSVMFHAKLNAAGQSDGIADLYVDGVLYGTMGSREIVDSDNDYITTIIWIDNFILNDTPIGFEQIIYYDDLVIATTYQEAIDGPQSTQANTTISSSGTPILISPTGTPWVITN